MFEAVREFIRSLGFDDGTAEREGLAAAADDPRVAAAALLHHVAEADGRGSASELARLTRLLADEYGLTSGEAGRIAEAGRVADADAVDLYAFTSVLLRRLSVEERHRFVELLWEVAFVDGEVHELEDNIVWRVCELLGVSTRDRMTAKGRAAGRRAPHDESA